MIDLISIFTIAILSIFGISFLPTILGTSTVPFLSFFFVIGLAYFQRGFGPILIAALSGAILDFYSASPFGLHLGLFLVVAVLIRFLFQEGMREMAFGHYIAVALSALTAYFVADGLFLYFAEASIRIIPLLRSFLIFMGLNLIFVILMYFFNKTYFDYIQKLRHYLKQR